MYVRWQSRKRRSPEFGRGRSDVHWAAILVESKRIKGKPTQQHIAFLIGFTKSRAKIPVQRCHLWDDISECLDRLGNRVNAADRRKIEAAIRKKLPRPTPAEYKELARKSARKLGWEWISKHQKAALQDEADQYIDRPGGTGRTNREVRG